MFILNCTYDHCCHRALKWVMTSSQCWYLLQWVTSSRLWHLYGCPLKIFDYMCQWLWICGARLMVQILFCWPSMEAWPGQITSLYLTLRMTELPICSCHEERMIEGGYLGQIILATVIRFFSFAAWCPVSSPHPPCSACLPWAPKTAPCSPYTCISPIFLIVNLTNIPLVFAA